LGTASLGCYTLIRAAAGTPNYNWDLQATTLPNTTESGIPWYIWTSVAAITSAMVGAHWDISWHESIGRDTFWTPAHLAIHLCGILAGISAAYLILSTTFNPASPLRAVSVRMWGFYGPMGAFIMAWGGLGMITSAPFDNWWHDAYGLDVKILSPPHALLALGVFGVILGVLSLLQAYMNRAEGAARSRYVALSLYAAGIFLVSLVLFQLELTTRIFMHTVFFYRVLAMTIPLVLPRMWRATGYPWAATSCAAVYSVFLLLMGHILPLFPAEPKLGPVYQHVTQLMPPEFPILLIAPAFVLDLLWQHTGNWPRWRQAFVSGIVFLAVLAAVQWPFADFLMSPAARNYFWGAKYFAYFQPGSSFYVRYLFIPMEQGADFWREIALAIVIATGTTWIGLMSGDWLRRTRR
jgi:hypothetical protein